MLQLLLQNLWPKDSQQKRSKQCSEYKYSIEKQLNFAMQRAVFRLRLVGLDLLDWNCFIRNLVSKKGIYFQGNNLGCNKNLVSKRMIWFRKQRSGLKNICNTFWFPKENFGLHLCATVEQTCVGSVDEFLRSTSGATLIHLK